MAYPIRAEVLALIQASIGWAVLAARAVNVVPTPPVAPPPPVARQSKALARAPVRLRATITIDIDAPDADEAERACDDVRGQFEILKRTHPLAELAFQRRKPRTGRRPPTPALVVSPYVDD
ncbi:hypothetical protein [Brevundimonas sp.]|uniref:hypothetical protein n=1 Tax=Brevundimonas sp. TaxID=1871086 RepID=UPI00286C9B70|nr:hypothetical protein [Brevundimonas sp.]